MKPLLPYQIEGANWLAKDERCGLHDDMGVGKTAQAIHALDLVGAKRIMIVAPAGVVDAGVWPNEFKKWSPHQRKVLKGKSVHELGAWLKGRADVLTLSYERATLWAKYLDEAIDFYDAIIFDESHYLKNHEAKRTKAALGADAHGDGGMARWFLRAWFLTGTPMPNDPIDLWTTMRFTNATPLSLEAFRRRYFKSFTTTFATRQKAREDMLPELRMAMRAKFLRRTFDDIGIQLPPAYLTTLTVDGDLGEVQDLLRQYPGLDEAILEAIEKGSISFLDAQHIATLRRLVGEAKAPAYANIVAEELHNGLDRIVIGGLHTKALHMIADILTEEGHKVAMFVGATSSAQREAAVADFQAGKLNAIVGHMKSLGTGITLTSGAAIDVFEESWTPADNAQFLKRVHRLGQTRNVRSRFISLANSIDELVSERVADKTAAIFTVQGS